MDQTKKDELITALVLHMAEIVDESQQSGYQGHGLVPRFFDEVRKFADELEKLIKKNELPDS